jgi:phosphoribosylformylglycinamidine cyclo-ligase
MWGSVLDMAKVDLKIVEQVAVGLVGAAADAQVAIINGELAELPGRISGYGSSPLNWNAACFWAADREKLKSWSRATGGDVVVGVAERGFRSNGFSLLRAIFRSNAGADWGKTGAPALLELIRFAAQPSIIYSRFLLSLTGGLTGAWTAGLRGIIHVTGGGLLGRALYYCHTNGVRLRIGDDLRPPQPMRDICELGGVNLDEAYRTWNMGIGLLIS